MLIEFTRDFQSAHTGERFYVSGAKAELAEEHARALIDEGAAVFVPIEARRGQAEPKAPARKGHHRG